jgi:hypothetical protein
MLDPRTRIAALTRSRMTLLLPSDAFERRPILLHIHEAAGCIIAFHPLICLWIVRLTAVANGTVPMTVSTWRVSCHANSPYSLGGIHEHPLVLPHVSHFRQVPLRTIVKL